MGRLIDADALDNAFTELRFNADGELAHWGDRKDWCLHGNEIEKLIADAPTVDAVEVVRCKDCYYCATEKSFGKEYLYCNAFYEHAEGDLIGVSLMVEPNHFCAYGERREHGNEPKPA